MSLPVGNACNAHMRALVAVQLALSEPRSARILAFRGGKPYLLQGVL